MTDPSTTRLLTVPEVAEWLRISTSLVYQLADAGKLPVHRIGNGRGTIRFRPEDIEAYLDACRTENCPPATPRKLRPKLKHIKLD